MNENLNEEKVVETVETTEEPIEVIPGETASAEENQSNKKDNFFQKIIPIIKSKAFIICSAIVIYTIIVASITVKIDRAIIANQIQKSFQEAFSFDDDNSSNSITNNTKEEEKEPEKNEKKLNLNQTVTIGDVMELTLESSEWVEEIKPSNTSGVYSYYENKDGEKYFVIKGKAKNIAGENLDIQYANESQILINDTYKANVTIEAEETDGTSFYGDIKPLQTLNIIAYASISDEAYDICENIKLTLNVLSDSTYIRNFYDEDNPHETYSIEFKNTNNEE